MFSIKSSALIRKNIKYVYRSSNRWFCNKSGEESGDGGDGWPRRVVTGLQPTGELHVGNYFGVLRRCVQLQEQGDDVMVFIADLHSFTGRQHTISSDVTNSCLVTCQITCCHLRSKKRCL
ncbi:PREDICTED: tryptophan--tRNA ligase isoform X2 [Papilio polytes]|uniref:tryptophan--tRNA ligase isoform X2 n=1 Tax=Papilio polytes TaxID=76194 RepID=UPI0006767074|nr:PREDICTED: tryptophan--tRNA ligase isoform X2 [Papilio polytes]